MEARKRRTGTVRRARSPIDRATRTLRLALTTRDRLRCLLRESLTRAATILKVTEMKKITTGRTTRVTKGTIARDKFKVSVDLTSLK